MSSKDDKADLSNLKSRLGLNKKKKSGGDAESSTSSTSSKSSSGAQKARKPGDSGASATKSGGTSRPKKAGGVDDRLAALKESTLGKKEPEPEPEPAQILEEEAQPQQHSGASAGASGAGGAGQAAGGGSPAQPAQPGGFQGPPPGAQGPPPTARPSSQQSGPQQQQSSPDPVVDPGAVDDADLDDINLSEIGVDDDSIFSPPVLVVLGVLLVVGLIFGFLANQSMQARQLEQARIADAAALQEEIEPRLDDFDRAMEIIEGLDPSRVDFEAVEELRELEFAIDARVLPGNRILLGEQIIGPLNRYMGESNVLLQLINQHAHLTTGPEREELEVFMEEIEEVDEDEQIAALFDVGVLQTHLIQVLQDEALPGDYIPRTGRLVRIPDDFEDLEPDEDGMVEVEFVSSGASTEAELASLVPIVFSDFIDVEAGNAMQRHQERVAQLQQYIDDLSGSVPVLREQVEAQATADPPALFTLTASEDPAEEMDDEELEEIIEPDEPSEPDEPAEPEEPDEQDE